MDTTSHLIESPEDHLSRRIRDARDRLLVAQQKVGRIQAELDGLKRQRNAQGMNRQKHIRELFLRTVCPG